MPFEPGKSGNPSGTRKERLFREALLMQINEAGPDRKILRQIADKLLFAALEGKMDAIKEVADRIDGKVPQGVIGGDEDDPAMKVINEVYYHVVDPPKLNGPT